MKKKIIEVGVQCPPGLLWKDKGYTANLAIRSPRSGPCPSLWVTSHHPVSGHTLHQHKLLGVGCLHAISYLCGFAHPGPPAWSDLGPCAAHFSITSTGFSLGSLRAKGPSSGPGSWPSPGTPVTLCPPCPFIRVHLCPCPPAVQDTAFPNC